MNKVKGTFVNIEGLSGIGKSTISEMLVKQIGATFVKTVPHEFDGLRKFLDQSTSINARFCLFLSAVFYSTDKIEQLLKAGKSVVVESYFYRTIAFHRGMGSKLDFKIPDDVIMPTLTVYLTCDEGELRRRKEERDKQTNYWVRLADEREKYIFEEYRRFYNQMYVVDTTSLSPEMVVQQIVNHLKSF